jgi:hypothetical protein
MIWMTWQQHRWQALIIGIALVSLALFLVLIGIHVSADYQPVVACLAPALQSSTRCGIIIDAFKGTYQNMDTAMMLLLLFIPLVVGILIGGPLVAREVEEKTYQFVWTQGITRQHWVIVKLVLILLIGALLEGAITSLWIRYHVPLEMLYQSPLDPLIFDTKGIVPIASVLFALSLAIAMGALMQRTVPAIALTIVLYLIILLPIINLRDVVLPATFVTWDGITQVEPSLPAGAKEMGSGFMDHQMHIVSNAVTNAACGNDTHFEQCLHDHGWSHYDVYLPTSWFWPLQIGEVLLFLVFSIVLVAVTIWWVRYHIH